MGESTEEPDEANDTVVASGPTSTPGGVENTLVTCNAVGDAKPDGGWGDLMSDLVSAANADALVVSGTDTACGSHS
jgi:hypothetical protein